MGHSQSNVPEQSLPEQEASQPIQRPTPPADSGTSIKLQATNRLRQLVRLRRRYPRLFATRHVLITLLKMSIPLLGIGALIVGFLPHIDWGWAAELVAWLRWTVAYLTSWLPDIRWPSLVPPDVVAMIRAWIAQLRAWLEWIRQLALVQWGKWILALIIAVAVAIKEVHRQRQKRLKVHTNQTDNKNT